VAATASPRMRRAASLLWKAQVQRRLATVVSPPSASGTTWSSSMRVVAPQIPPESSGCWQRFPSRRRTSRSMAAGRWGRARVGVGAAFAVAVGAGVAGRGRLTSALRRACCSRRRSSAVSRTCSVVAQGSACDRPSRARSSFSSRRRETVTWSRRRSASSGSASSGSSPRAGWVGASSCARTGLAGGSTRAEGPAAGSGASRFTRTAEAAVASWSGVTASRRGGSARGASAAATSRASREEQPKNRGSTSDWFSSVSTRANSPTAERQSRPERSAAATSGKRGSSRAAEKRR